MKNGLHCQGMLYNVNLRCPILSAGNSSAAYVAG